MQLLLYHLCCTSHRTPSQDSSFPLMILRATDQGFSLSALFSAGRFSSLLHIRTRGIFLPGKESWGERQEEEDIFQLPFRYAPHSSCGNHQTGLEHQRLAASVFFQASPYLENLQELF